MLSQEWRARIAQDQAAKVDRYRLLNETVPKGQILFVGSSLMEQFPVEQFVKEAGLPCCVINRGISGYVISELEASLEECILQVAPRRMFINIGTNDLTREVGTPKAVVSSYEALVDQVLAVLPELEVCLMAYYPVNPECAPNEGMRNALRIRNNERINEANMLVAEMADRRGFTFIDVNDPLKDEQGKLKAEYTTEGMHIKPEGYRAIMPLLTPWILKGKL